MNKKYNHIDIEYALEVLNNPQLSLEDDFREWISDKDNLELYKELRRYREAGFGAENYKRPDVDKEWNKFNRKGSSKSLFILWGSIAASIIILLSITFLLRFDGLFDKLNNENISEVISSGSGKAILVTSDGQEIVLGDKSSQIIKGKYGRGIVADSNNVIKYLAQGKAVDSPSKEMESHTLKIPTGGEYQMVLADGTKVWLNSESELKYPTEFSGDKRVVELKGEAYFQVHHDKTKPFIVKTNKVDTRVLGTEFNVNAYSKEDMNITLVAGSVMLSNKLNKVENKVMLKPGENAFLNPEGDNLEVSKVDVSKFIAWREGYFHFDRERLEDILIKLERWYDFQVFYKNPSVKDYVFKMRADRHASFNEVIKRLEATNRIKVRVKGKTIIISDVRR